MGRLINVACLQTEPQPDFGSAIAAIKQLFSDVGDANLVCLPEYCGGLQMRGRVLAAPSETEDRHPVLKALRRIAASRSIWLQIGSIALRDRSEDDRIVNRGYLIGPTGDIRSRYDKIHLFDVDLSANRTIRESDSVTPGTRLSVTHTDIGILGHTICYDLRFPHMYRDLSLQGAEILTIPAAFMETTGRAHWHVLNRARAIENGAFVVSACAVGLIPGGDRCYGHSLIINPWGEVLADGGSGPGVIHATIDLDEVAATRQQIPSLTRDRQYEVANRIDDSNRSTD